MFSTDKAWTPKMEVVPEHRQVNKMYVDRAEKNIGRIAENKHLHAFTLHWQGQILLQDESRFCLSNDSRHIRVWQRPRDRTYLASTVESHTSRQRGILARSGTAYNRRAPEVLIVCSMTSQIYLGNVLHLVTLHLFKGIPNSIYLQDKATPHRVRVSQHVL
ncbi:transposable element Tc1 transposase [Nephila pilipes]|uniref:Transposable element Tc1 transposase n=1 Tax=Nephila pilipes TaxID=299642 RepID=A0A8X6TUD3_NEPPI|nr:transposable element Tc1 transposase [Nephila pilipes]